MSTKSNKKKSNWSKYVTENSDALDLDIGVFTWSDPVKIAKSLKKSADRDRKTMAFKSAMSMLCFYINRAGSNLSKERLKILNQAKIELRILFKK